MVYLFPTFPLEMATVNYYYDWNPGVQAEKLIVAFFESVYLKGTKEDIT